MSAVEDRVIGMIVETTPDGRELRQRIVASPWYGITCERMSTNGNPRPIVDLAANRTAIVARNHDQGITRYALDVLIEGRSVADLPPDDILSSMLRLYGGRDHVDQGHALMSARGREGLKEQR